jgi:histidyl-tRNA synthetase
LPKRIFRLPRGMRDLTVEDVTHISWINNKLFEVLRHYGFKVVEPSPIENLETLEAKCGSGIKDEIYWFEDKAGRQVGLRFDLTVGLTRMVASHPNWITPMKLAAISNMWRYDEPQFGRYRCFYQWDAEIYGSPEPEADAEIISLSQDCLIKFGLKDFETRISNRKLVEGLLLEMGLTPGIEIDSTLRVIDKYRKLSTQELDNSFIQLGLKQEQVNKLRNFISIQDSSDKALDSIASVVKNFKDNKKISKGLQELNSLVQTLESFGKSKHYVLDLSIVRGISYYDGIVFEIYDKAGEDIGAVVGGGRFDGLTSIFGRDLPATGVAGGIERLILSLERAGLFPNASQNPQLFVAIVSDDVKRKAIELITYFRSKGFSVDWDTKLRPLKKQLEYADSNGIAYAVIVGKRELEKGKVKLRDMHKRNEIEVTAEEIPNKIVKS